MYTHCAHVQQVQLMRLSRVVLACTTWRQPGLSLARWTLVLASQVVCFLFVCVFITFLGGVGVLGCIPIQRAWFGSKWNTKVGLPTHHPHKLLGQFQCT
jgi:hypothetical protein